MKRKHVDWRPIHPTFKDSDHPKYYSGRCWDMAIQKAIIFLNNNGFPDMKFCETKDVKVAFQFFRTLGLKDPKGEPVFRLMDLYLDDLWPFHAYDYGFTMSDEWRAMREKVFEKYGRKCAKCGETKNLHIDHIKPKSHYPGKRLDIGNLQVLCAFCNMSKGNRNQMDYTKRGHKCLISRTLEQEYIVFFKGNKNFKREPGQAKRLCSLARPYLYKAVKWLQQIGYKPEDIKPWFFKYQNGCVPMCLLGLKKFDEFYRALYCLEPRNGIELKTVPWHYPVMVKRAAKLAATKERVAAREAKINKRRKDKLTAAKLSQNPATSVPLTVYNTPIHIF